MKTLNMHGSFYDLEDEPTRLTTKLLLGIMGIWFVAAFVGGMKGLFSQPDEPPLYVGLWGCSSSCPSSALPWLTGQVREYDTRWMRSRSG